MSEATLTFYDTEQRECGTVTVTDPGIPHVYPLGAGVASVKVTLWPASTAAPGIALTTEVP